MHSPIQRWLADLSIGRWEQPSYASLEGLSGLSAVLRKRQALDLWDAGVLHVCHTISPGTWATRYATLAPVLFKGCPERFKWRPNATSEYLWLRQCALMDNIPVRSRPAAMQAHASLLRTIGHDHVLARTMISLYCEPKEQIAFWRTIFSDEPMHEKMGIAMDVGAVRRPTLDGYLRARKHLSGAPEEHEGVDLSMLLE